MTVGELLARMSGQEFVEWIAFHSLEPWGDWRADYRAGLVTATLVNVNKGKDGKLCSPLDFMPLIERLPQPVSAAEVHAKLLAWLPPKSAPEGAPSEVSP